MTHADIVRQLHVERSEMLDKLIATRVALAQAQGLLQYAAEAKPNKDGWTEILVGETWREIMASNQKVLDTKLFGDQPRKRRYEIVETTHGFEVLRDGEALWELGHCFTTREQAEADVAALNEAQGGGK